MRPADKYGLWIVLDLSSATKANGYAIRCRCVCGTEKLVSKKYLIKGKSKSCGCRGVYPGISLGQFTVVSRVGGLVLVRCEHGRSFSSRYSRGGLRTKKCPCLRFVDINKKHGESPHSIRTREYNRWRSMRQRCNSPKNHAFKYYGGRGIRVCARWNRYENFLSDMGRCPPGYSIDRIDSNAGYSPKNCRWADSETQNNNRRFNRLFELNGKSQTVDRWARELGIPRHTIWSRIYRGISFLDAVTVPVRGRRTRKSAQHSDS